MINRRWLIRINDRIECDNIYQFYHSILILPVLAFHSRKCFAGPGGILNVSENVLLFFASVRKLSVVSRIYSNSILVISANKFRWLWELYIRLSLVAGLFCLRLSIFRKSLEKSEWTLQRDFLAVNFTNS